MCWLWRPSICRCKLLYYFYYNGDGGDDYDDDDDDHDGDWLWWCLHQMFLIFHIYTDNVEGVVNQFDLFNRFSTILICGYVFKAA